MLDINLDSKSDSKYKYVFKHSDEKVNEWLKAQGDKSFSLRYLIHKAISSYGYADMQDIAIEEFADGSEAEFERRIGRLILYGRS